MLEALGMYAKNTNPFVYEVEVKLSKAQVKFKIFRNDSRMITDCTSTREATDFP